MAGAGLNYNQQSSKSFASTKEYRDLLQSAIGDSRGAYSALIGNQLSNQLGNLSTFEANAVANADISAQRDVGGLAPGSVSTAGTQAKMGLLSSLLQSRQGIYQQNAGLQAQSIESWLNALKGLAALSGGGSGSGYGFGGDINLR